MKTKNLLQQLVKDIQVDLTQEFDRNFERKAFFNQKWSNTKHHNTRGSLMLRTGRLRNSVNSSIHSAQITWKSNVPYAEIHNKGGKIKVTKKMKAFFWAMYYKSFKAVGDKPSGLRNKKLNQESAKWKAMALLPEGKVIKIEKRQFIGEHPVVNRKIHTIVKNNIDKYSQQIAKKYK